MIQPGCLYGFALECTLKGIAAAKSPSEFPFTHDLLELVEVAQVEVDDESRRLLKHLARYTTWAGRYPFPRDEAEIPPRDPAGILDIVGLEPSSQQPIAALFERSMPLLQTRSAQRGKEKSRARGGASSITHWQRAHLSTPGRRSHCARGLDWRAIE